MGFSKRSVTALSIFLAFMLTLFGVAYLKSPELSEAEFLQLSAEEQYEILVANGMEPYPEMVDKDFHIQLIDATLEPIIKGGPYLQTMFSGNYAGNVIQARIAKTLYEMGYPKVINPPAPSYYGPEEFNEYVSRVDSMRLEAWRN